MMFLSSWMTGFSAVFTVVNSGFTFSPATITIQLGDTVNFVLGGTHDAREVSQTTWNANGTTALLGGFQVAFGGGTLTQTQLGVGTHFYVCSNHAGMGMKGKIIVQNTTGIGENSTSSTLSVTPNPSRGIFQFAISSSGSANSGMVEVYDLSGKRVYQSDAKNTKFTIDLTAQAKGTYFVKFYNDETTLTKKIVLE